MTRYFLFIAFLNGPCRLAAQSYEILSPAIVVSGALSGGGRFSLTSVTREVDGHALLSGGSYSLTGGFSGQYNALQQQGSPRLQITKLASGVTRISWAAIVPGWRLEWNANLSSGSWSEVLSVPLVDGDVQYLDFAMAASTAFFRLKKL